MDKVDYEIRSSEIAPSIQGNTMVGYAAVFNSLSRDLGGFKEVIRHGAFKRALEAKTDVRALVEHDASMLLGRTSAGTVRLSEDDRGLKYEVDLPDTSYANDLKVLMKRGDVTKSSFGFRVSKDGQKFRREGDYIIRELHDLDLVDVSPVTSQPAYNATSVSLRSVDEFRKAEEAEIAEQAKAAIEAEEKAQAEAKTQEDQRAEVTKADTQRMERNKLRQMMAELPIC